MEKYGGHPSLKRDTAPVDEEVWRWFVLNGPHGRRFRWARDRHTRSSGSVVRLRDVIAERSEMIPKFEEHAREIAVEALESDDGALITKGIHVLTAVGTDEEMQLLVPFVDDECEVVADHARAALFERGIKSKS